MAPNCPSVMRHPLTLDALRRIGFAHARKKRLVERLARFAAHRAVKVGLGALGRLGIQRELGHCISTTMRSVPQSTSPPKSMTLVPHARAPGCAPATRPSATCAPSGQSRRLSSFFVSTCACSGVSSLHTPINARIPGPICDTSWPSTASAAHAAPTYRAPTPASHAAPPHAS